jgi:8-oxo-dGTP pyrophosphatase MutT (NUDIX family)
MFFVAPMLKSYVNQFNAIYSDFTDYKISVPVCGGILLNTTLDKVILVKTWKGNSWGFPKGKIAEDESDIDCAKREILEEIGYDCSSKIKEQDSIIVNMGRGNSQRKSRVHLYIIPYVKEDFNFETRTVKEIGAIEWHDVKKLPSYSLKEDLTYSQYYLVAPFVKGIIDFINKKKDDRKKSNHDNNSVHNNNTNNNNNNSVHNNNTSNNNSVHNKILQSPINNNSIHNNNNNNNNSIHNNSTATTATTTTTTTTTTTITANFVLSKDFRFDRKAIMSVW